MIDVLVSMSLPGWLGISTNESGVPCSCRELLCIPSDSAAHAMPRDRMARLAREIRSSPPKRLLSGKTATGCTEADKRSNEVCHCASANLRI